MTEASRFRCADIVRATRGRLLQGDPETPFSGLSTDTRTIKRGEVFLALKGEHFDGHTFVPDAVEKGAAGAIVQNGDVAQTARKAVTSVPLIAVSETLKALGDTARYWRDKFSIPLVGITGSNGKTSTKELIAFLLEERFRVLKSPGNYNNLVGVPLTLLDLEPVHDVAIVEMGTNTPGEIKRLSEITRPTVGIITNIGQAHLEGMGTMDRLVREKSELFRAVEPGGVLVVNNNDPHVSSLAHDSPARVIRYGVDTDAHVMVSHVQCRGSQGLTFRLAIGGDETSIDLPVVGLQFVENMAAAAAVVSLFEMGVKDIQNRMKHFKTLPMRMEIMSIRGVNLINDAYNANPPSVKKALETLAHIEPKGRTFVVLGDMLELGDTAQKAHRSVGRLTGTLGLMGLFLLGRYAPEVAHGAVEQGMARDRIWIGRTHRDIANLLKAHMRSGDWILVKGSRGMHMEAVIDILRNDI